MQTRIISLSYKLSIYLKILTTIFLIDYILIMIDKMNLCLVGRTLCLGTLLILNVASTYYFTNNSRITGTVIFKCAGKAKLTEESAYKTTDTQQYNHIQLCNAELHQQAFSVKCYQSPLVWREEGKWMDRCMDKQQAVLLKNSNKKQ